MTDNTFYVTLLNFKSEQRERNLMSVLMVSALKCHNNHFLHTHPAMSRDHWCSECACKPINYDTIKS